jgi:hypothetical protein
VDLIDHVERRELPPRGLVDLQDAVRRKLAWAESLPSQTLLDSTIYRLLLQVIFAGLYVLAPQGRVEAFGHLSLAEVQKVMREAERAGRVATVLSRTFKTYSIYGYQPVIIPGELVNVINKYISISKEIRTRTDAGVSAGLGRVISDPFFIAFDGTPILSQKFGSYVTSFFKESLHIHITTTMIRCYLKIYIEYLVYFIVTDLTLFIYYSTGHWERS